MRNTILVISYLYTIFNVKILSIYEYLKYLINKFLKLIYNLYLYSILLAKKDNNLKFCIDILILYKN